MQPASQSSFQPQPQLNQQKSQPWWHKQLSEIMDQHKAVILCVDDEANPLALRKLVLQKAGYEVLTANSAKDAIALAATRHFDLVLSDYLMPGTTGTELAEKLRAEHPTLPIILISGVNELPAGSTIANAFVSKIEGPDALCKEVAAVLNLPSETFRDQKM